MTGEQSLGLSRQLTDSHNAFRTTTGPKIAILANFPAREITDMLHQWFERLELGASVSLESGDSLQHLLDERSAFYSADCGIILLNLDRCVPHQAQGDLSAINENVEFLAQTIERIARRSVPLLLLSCANLQGEESSVHAMEQALCNRLISLKSVETVKAEAIASLYPVQDPFERFGNESSQVDDLLYTRVYLATLATVIARRLYVRFCRTRKVIVVDCDNTLWTGNCGEVSSRGVSILAGNRAFQEELVRQYELGKLLCICSKNNEKDVLDVLREHPEMILRTTHLTAHRINWESKHDNVRSLSKELNLDLGSFIFLDDSPYECALMESQCPDVLTVLIPHEQAEIPRVISRIWDFDPGVATWEDKNRTALYREASAREGVRGASHSLEEFVAALKIRVTFAPLAISEIGRMSQLALRVTQFNLNGRLLTTSELWALAGSQKCWTIRVTDRFGDYGIVGAFVFENAGKEVFIRSLLLSCRALGRGVEFKISSYLMKIAREFGAECLVFDLQPTSRNLPVQAFLDEIGAIQGVNGRVVPVIATTSNSAASEV
jgi:FkbH-like protein